MALVHRAFVAQLEQLGMQGREALAHGLLDRMHHGNTFLNGLTVTLAYTPPAEYGSSAAHAIAASREANSATTSDPLKPAGPGSAESIAGWGPAMSKRPSACRAFR